MRPKYRTKPTKVDASEHGRRFRNEAQPTNKRYVLTDRKIRLLRAMRFGPVPSGLLVRPFYDGEPGYKQTVLRQLTDLFHEDFEGKKLVWRPDELNPEAVLGQQAVYDLTDWGDEVAEIVRSVPRRDHDRHRCMGACIDLSFEQLAPDHGLIFHDQEEIFAHPACPQTTRDAENPLLVKMERGYYEPDKLHSFERKSDGMFRFWISERNRAVGFSRAKGNNNKDKLDHQLELIENRLYKQWGIPGISVMWETTKQSDVDIMLRYLKGKKHAEKFYFKVLPRFSTKSWKLPKEPMEELFTDWQTVNGPKSIFA